MKYLLSILLLTASHLALAGSANQTNAAAAGAPVASTNPPPFAEVVNRYFSQWDADGDGKLTPDEISTAVVNPAYHDEAAAALAAIKTVVRGGKYNLPPITLAYLVASPLREATASKEPVELRDDPAQPKITTHQPAFQPRYRSALSRLRRTSRELFPQSQPSLAACRQGPLGDCYFVSVVGAMIYRNPAAVEGMFTQNSDGSTTVAFGNGHKVIVPPLTDAEIAISSTAGTNGLWLTVLENAYGKFRQESKPGYQEDQPDTDAIANGGRPEYVINVLDGYKARFFALTLTNGQQHSSRFVPDLQRDLSAALQDHRLAEATTPTNSLPPGINPKHAYAILSYNSDAGVVRLWNPHGNFFKPKGPDSLKNGYTTKAGQFNIPLQELLAIYKRVIIETSAPIQPAKN